MTPRARSLLLALASSLTLWFGAPVAFADDTNVSKPLYVCPDLQQQSEASDFGEALYQAGDGWFFRDADFNHLYGMSDRTIGFMQRLRDALKTKGIELVVLPVPPKPVMAASYAETAGHDANITYDPLFAEQQFEGAIRTLADAGLNIVDVLGYMESHHLDRANTFYKRDLHWTPRLSQISAEATADLIRRLPVGGQIPNTQYVTKLADEIIYQPVMATLLRRICKASVPFESLDDYVTKKANESADDFLADASAVPPISLVGTSFTEEAAQKFNFAGFLRDAAQADVAAYSFAGANVEQSLLQWVFQGNASKQGTKILLWELPYLERLEGAAARMDDQVIAAISGPCTGTDREVVSASYDVSADRPLKLAVDLQENRPDAGYYISIRTSEPLRSALPVEVTYANGRVDYQPIVKLDRASNVTNYFAEFSADAGAMAKSVQVAAPVSETISGTISVCKFPNKKRL